MYKGLGYLRLKLATKKQRVDTRYEYYEMKNNIKDFQSIIPPNYRWLRETLGWCAKSVDVLAQRLVFKEFKYDNFGINEIFERNNKDILVDSAMLGALISSCDFIYISKDENGYPKLQVIDGGNATGIIDPVTNLLTEGYAVLSRDADNKMPIDEAYFTKEYTDIYTRGKFVQRINNVAPYALLVPIIYKPDSKRPFGHSRISRACMGIQQSAMRTLKRSEVSAEFYSFPQKYVTGLSEDAEQLDKFKATMSAMLQFSKDEDGDSPTLGQFSQQSMTPYVDQIKMFASLFAGETGLTLDDLGFVTSNPSSAESIKASHENLRLIARKAQRDFSVGLLNVGYLAACIRDENKYSRDVLYLTQARWEPIFEPDSAALGAIGDGVIKINQGIPGYIDEEIMEDLTGIKK